MPNSIPNNENALVFKLEKALCLHAKRCAVKVGSTSFTYGEIESISRACAGELQQQRLNISAPVALLMRHDAPLIAMIVGVLRSGRFYVALNPNHPPSQLRAAIAEIRPCAIIADDEHLSLATEVARPNLATIVYSEICHSTAAFVRARISATSLFALFYTSGSSQKPKPLVYNQVGALENTRNNSRSLSICAQDRLTLLSPCSAAASVLTIFGALLEGACLLPLEPAQSGLRKMRVWINEEQISIYHSVPSLFRRFARSLGEGEKLRSIRILKLGGEPIFATDVELFRNHCRPEAVLVNALGLTEAHGNVCHFHVHRNTPIENTIVPVGETLPGIDVRLVDEESVDVSSPQIGEIIVRSKYLSPGFWTGTAVQRYETWTGDWLRTGDMARRNADGLLEHLGRKDNQLKVRGEWVNLSAIEAALMQMPQVREAAVVAFQRYEQENGIAAFVCSNNGAISEQQLRNGLERKLQRASVPSHFFTLDRMPLLAGGKIDRLELSQLAITSLWSRNAKPDPTDRLAVQLVRIWEDVLNRDAIGVADNFFALGGDSLAAVTMLAAVERLLGIELAVSTLAEAATIEELARLIHQSGYSEAELQLVPLQLRGNKPPLYCVPAAGCTAFEFWMLAQHLGNDQPVFAFQPRGLDGHSAYLRSVEEMAQSNIEALRRHQPHGPYDLCGNSFGGVVAFEMAKRLRNQGEQVRFLGLLDSYAGAYPTPRKDLTLRNRVKLALLNFVPIGVYAFDWSEFKAGITEWTRRQLFELGILLNWRTLRRPYRWRTLFLQQVCFAARRRYQFQPFAGRIHLFRAELQPPADVFQQDCSLGWNGMAGEGIEIHQISGSHNQYMREPHVADMAGELKSCLERARSEQLSQAQTVTKRESSTVLVPG